MAVAVPVGCVVPVGEGSGVVADAENRSAQKPWLGPTAVAKTTKERSFPVPRATYVKAMRCHAVSGAR